ncbi:MAG: hypothetical protein FWD32_02765, partial [Firmicutes bacterium]|nr:hypothetical protein [Bacillota bacterium]
MRKIKNFCFLLVACALLTAHFFTPLSFLAVPLRANTSNGIITQIDQPSTIFVQSPITVGNGDFSTFDVNEDLLQGNGLSNIQNWNALNDKKETFPTESGIITAATFDSYVEKTGNTGLTNPNLNAGEGAMFISGNNSNLGMGFTTQNSFTLLANSYYAFNIVFQTQNGGTASFVLNGDQKLDDTNNNTFIGLSTSVNSWQTASFYVATNSKEDQSTVNLEIYLEDKIPGFNAGALYVRSVTAFRYSNEEFYNQYRQSFGGFRKLIDLSNKSILPNGDDNDKAFIQNFELERPINYLEFTPKNDDAENRGASGLHNYVNSIPQLPNPTAPNGIAYVDEEFQTYSNKRGLLFYSVQESTICWASTPITIKQQQNYAFNVWVLGNASAYIRIKEVGEDGNIIKMKDEFISVSYTATGEHNGWALNTVFITGNPIQDTQITIELWMGKVERIEGSEDKNTQNTTGYIWWDNISLEQISPNYLSTNGSRTNTSITNLNPYESNSGIISNGAFNSTEIIGDSVTYPLTASGGWEADYLHSSTYKNGIISTNYAHFNQNKTDANGNLAYKIPYPLSGTSFQSTYNEDSVNNVFLMQSAGKLFSPSFALAANQFYAISFEIHSFYDVTANAMLMIEDASTAATTISTMSLESNLHFTTFTFFVKTHSAQNNYKLIFTLEDNKGAYILDNVIATQIREAVYNSSANTSTSNVIDLKNSLSTNFTQPMFKSNVLDGSNALVNMQNTGEVLRISNSVPSNCSVSQVLKMDMQMGAFYRATVDIRIVSINKGGSVAIRLSELNESFKDITTTNGEFVTYSFYIQATT